jgi:hypothetical protein
MNDGRESQQTSRERAGLKASLGVTRREFHSVALDEVTGGQIELGM